MACFFFFFFFYLFIYVFLFVCLFGFFSAKMNEKTDPTISFSDLGAETSVVFNGPEKSFKGVVATSLGRRRLNYRQIIRNTTLDEITLKNVKFLILNYHDYSICKSKSIS